MGSSVFLSQDKVWRNSRFSTNYVEMLFCSMGFKRIDGKISNKIFSQTTQILCYLVFLHVHQSFVAMRRCRDPSRQALVK